MKIEIRSDNTMKISGYVNTVCRDSRPIITPRGKVVEQVEEGVFRRAIERAQDIALRLNHYKKDYAHTSDGTLKLKEDSIGLRAEAVISDKEMIEKAKNKEFVGWSWGAYITKDEMEERADDIPRRHVKEMELFEVSLIDKRKNPCYTGTLVEQRAEEEIIIEERSFEADVTVETPQKTINYSEYEEKIKELKGE